MILSDPPQTWLDWLGVTKGLRATQVPIKKKEREIWGVAKKTYGIADIIAITGLDIPI
jgi:hypothetical protein